MMRFRRRHRHLLPPLHYYRHLRRNETGRMLEVRANLLPVFQFSFFFFLLFSSPLYHITHRMHPECSALLQVFDVWRRFPVRLFQPAAAMAMAKAKLSTNMKKRRTSRRGRRRRRLRGRRSPRPELMSSVRSAFLLVFFFCFYAFS